MQKFKYCSFVLVKELIILNESTDSNKIRQFLEILQDFLGLQTFDCFCKL
jgi:hypothetical protein